MDDKAQEVLAALDAVYALNAEAERLALVEVAVRTGTLQRCREGRDRARVAADLGWDETVAERFVTALVVHGILTDHAGTVTPSDPWRPFADPDTTPLLLDALGHGQARSTLVRALGSGEDYWSTDPALQLQLARGVTFDPSTSLALELRRAGAAQVPAVAAAIENGSRYLELGCGVGGRMLALLRHHPHLRAVGVELSEPLAREARRQADELGLADRCDVVVDDVANFRDPEPFDLCFWSQFFFPAASRAAALRTARACLRPGGVLTAPAPDLATPSPPYDAEALDAVTESLLWSTWGVPVTDSEAVRRELVDAGFQDTEIVAGTVPVVVGRAPR